MKRISLILLAASLLFSFASCAKKAQKESPAATSYQVTDSRGVQVTFNEVPQKIISLLPSDTEIIYAFGLGEKLIAVSTYCNYPEDTKNKQKLDSGSKMNIESIIALNPDVVFLGSMAQTEEQFKQLENAGIKVIVTNADNIEQTYMVIEMLGKVLKAEDKAGEIVNGMKKDFDDIKEQVKGKTAYKVYVEVSPVAYGPWTAGKNTFQDELLTLVGAKNIFDDMNGWQQVSEEQVISRNPDYIFTTDMYSYPDTVAEIKGRKNWADINAIKNGKVFLTDGDRLTRPGPRLVEAAKELVSKIYN